MLNLIDNSLMKYALSSSSNFKLILSFYIAQIAFTSKPEKTRVFPFFFSPARNPGFEILPRIGNTVYKILVRPGRELNPRLTSTEAECW